MAEKPAGEKVKQGQESEIIPHKYVSEVHTLCHYVLQKLQYNIAFQLSHLRFENLLKLVSAQASHLITG